MSAYWSTLVAGTLSRDRHHPTDPAALRVAAIELRQRGLTNRDIAAALDIGEAAVRVLINGAPCDSTDPSNP